MRQRVEFNRHIELGELNGAHSITMSFYGIHEEPSVQRPMTHQVRHLHAWRYLPSSQTLHLYPDYRLQDAIIGDMIDVDVKDVLESVFYESLRKYALAWIKQGNRHLPNVVNEHLKKLVIHWPAQKLTTYVKDGLLLPSAQAAIQEYAAKTNPKPIIDIEVVGE